MNNLLELTYAMARQRYTRERIQRYMLNVLKNIVNYSYHNISYYKKSFKLASFHPGAFRSVNDIKKLPLLKKEDILNNYDDLQNQRLPVEKIKSTSGSSGFPLKVAYDKKAHAISEAIYFRSMLNSGVRPFHKGLYFWARPYPEKSWYHNNLLSKSFTWTGFGPEIHVKHINHIKPDYWYTFPSILKLLLRESTSGKSLHNPKFIISTGEVLQPDLMLKASSHFKCPVYNHYGTQEINRQAASCANSELMHIDEDNLLIEFDKNNEEVSEGILGNIILTSFHNKRMPLIRYVVGDLGVKTTAKCMCSSPFHSIRKIVGRNDDIIKMEDGFLSPRAITGVFDTEYLFTNKVHSYKLIQNSVSKFTLHLVPGSKWRVDVEYEVKDSLKKLISKDIRVGVKLQEEIPRNLGGKHRYIYSEL